MGGGPLKDQGRDSRSDQQLTRRVVDWRLEILFHLHFLLRFQLLPLSIA